MVLKHKEIGGDHIEWLPFGLTLYYYVWTVTAFPIDYNVYFVTWGKILTCLATERKKMQKSVAAIFKTGRHFVLIGIVMPELI